MTSQEIFKIKDTESTNSNLEIASVSADLTSKRVITGKRWGVKRDREEKCEGIHTKPLMEVKNCVYFHNTQNSHDQKNP